MLTNEQIEEWFRSFPSDGHVGAMITCFKNAAAGVFNHTLSSPEQTLAIRKLQEAVFWSSQAVIADRKDPTR